jgi:hypothetical protein
MTTGITSEPIASGPRRRHQARVQKFSANPILLERLDVLSVSDDDVPDLVLSVCCSFGVEAPQLKFHGGRSPYTGATEPPRWLLVAIHGESKVKQLEREMAGSLSVFGAIRLGRTTTLMTLAHELGHHLVFSLDPVSTPAHGKRWVTRFDESAAAIEQLL